LGREHHAQAGAKAVLAQVGQLHLERLKVEWVFDELQVNFSQKFVAFQRAKPLDPADHARVLRILREAVVLELLIRLRIVLVLLRLLGLLALGGRLLLCKLHLLVLSGSHRLFIQFFHIESLFFSLSNSKLT
jgi:hypothetical protein